MISQLWYNNIILPIASVVTSLIAASLLLGVLGADPVAIYTTILQESFSTGYGFSETIVKATPICLCALAVAVPAWVGLMNVGAEGQLYIGAAAASGVALFFPSLWSGVLLPVMMITGIVAGGVWGASAGVLRSRFGVNEVMVTIMSNFVALLFVEYLVYGPWRDPASHGWPETARFIDAALLPHLGDSRVHLGTAMAVALAFALHVVRRRTTWGFAMRVIQVNQEAAEYAGIPISRYFIFVFLIGGGLAALAGACEVSGIQERLRPTISPGYGYTGILVSWMARHDPVVILLVALCIGGVLAGGDNLQIVLGLPFATVHIVLGLMFFFLLIGGSLVSQLRRP